MNEDNRRNEFEDASLDGVTAGLGRIVKSTDVTPRPGFKEALRLRLRERLAAPATMFSRFKLIAALSPALVVLIIAVLVFQPFFGVRTVYAYDQFTLVPDSSDALGVDADAEFILESRDPVSAADIRELIEISADGDPTYDVDQVSERSLRIAFASPLVADEVVTFSLPTTTTWPNGEVAVRDYNWAFQVKGDFRVVSTIPGDRAGQVPLDAGIEFVMSHENVDPSAFERALSISPPLKGHVESSRRSFVFVPEDIRPQTLYTVTLSGDLPLQGSDETLGADYSFSFETSLDAERGFAYAIDDRYNTVVPGEQVVLRYADWQQDEGGAIALPRVKVYRYGSFDEYVAALRTARDLDWRLFSTADSLIDTSVRPAYEFDASPIEAGWQTAFAFPEPLPAGYYVADIEIRGVRSWALLSSSNLTAYVSRGSNRTLFWINDASTGQPVVGADARYSGDERYGVTDAGGLASVESSRDQDDVVVIRVGDEALAVPLESNFVAYEGGERVAWASRRAGDGVAEDHWTYLYTDRSTYKPNDTMKYWGYVERRGDGERPDQVLVDVGFASATVDVTPNGTFAGEFVLRSVNLGYYPLAVSWDGVQISSRSVNVSEYVKPAYTLSIEFDAKAAFAGEEVGYTVHGEFFEGTPVKGLEVLVSGECEEEMLTLDAAGNARGSFSCAYDEGARRQYPSSTWLSVRPARPEEGEIETNGSVNMFGPKAYVDVSRDSNQIKDGIATVEAAVRNVEAIDSYDPAVFGPTVRAGQAVGGKIVEITYVRHESGTSYDFVRKQTVSDYWYERSEKTVGEFTEVSGPDGMVRHAFAASNPDANYRVELSARDESGRVAEASAEFWARREFEFGDADELSFHNDDAGEDQWDFSGYDVGERVNLSVYQYGRPFQAPVGGRFLYYQAHRGIRETELSARAGYAFAFEAEDVPNVAVYGVLFADGAYRQVGAQMGWWYGSSGFPVRYDRSASNLTVTVTPDRASYAPGVDATVSVHVEDAAGRPVKAEVNVNVVDEAYYALFPEDVDPLAELYRWVDDGVVKTQVTRDASVSFGLGAEKGGGGQRALGRHLFKDNAAFGLVHTDANGNGSMTFAVPDNITAWRVTAQALDADGKRAGDAVATLDATRPFFLNAVMRDSYLDADEPTLLVRAAGTWVGLGDAVSYTVRVPDASFERTFSAPAGETMRFDLPDLAIGTHDVTIAGTAGALEDTLTRTVTIVPSRLVRPVIAKTSGEDGASIVVSGASDRYTEVTFMDGAAGRYYGELQMLAGWSGDRADEALARVGAAALLNEWFGESHPVPEFDAESYWGGSVRLLPYADGDFDVSAKVALLADTPFDEAALAGYFSWKLDTDFEAMTPRERAMTYAALASLGEPVLAELQRAAAAVGDDVDARLWMALGLHGAGDDEGARRAFRALMADATERDGFVFLEGGEDETALERTALAAVLAGALNEPDRDKLHDYVLSVSDGDTTVPLERLLYAKETLPHLAAGETEFAYTLNGRRESASLAKGETRAVWAAPEDLPRFDIEVSRGSLAVVSRYDTPVVDPDAPVDDRLSVSRTITTGQGAGTEFSQGQLVKVELSYELPEKVCRPSVPCEAYQLTDVLPSGLSAVSISPEAGGECGTPGARVEDQRVSFYVTPSTVSDDSSQGVCDVQRVTYYARVVTPGIYLAEPAYIRSVRDPNIHNHSDAITVTIQP
jgi:hypothetical protein